MYRTVGVSLIPRPASCNNLPHVEVTRLCCQVTTFLCSGIAATRIPFALLLSAQLPDA